MGSIYRPYKSSTRGNNRRDTKRPHKTQLDKNELQMKMTKNHKKLARDVLVNHGLPVSQIVSFNFFPATVRCLILKSTPVHTRNKPNINAPN